MLPLIKLIRFTISYSLHDKINIIVVTIRITIIKIIIPSTITIILLTKQLKNEEIKCFAGRAK